MRANENLTLNEISVLNAVAGGVTTVEEIRELTELRTESIQSILSTLGTKNLIVYNSDGSFSAKPSEKKIRLGGNLNLPISTFQKDGQFYVVRGTWHKAPNDINLNDIEWFDDTEKETDLQKVMRGLREEKAKTRTKIAALPDIKDEDGEALPKHIEMLGAWRNVSENFKIYPCEVSAKRAIIEISPRYISEDGIEFPYGSCSLKKVITTEELEKAIEQGDESVLPKVELEEVINNLGNCLPVKPMENGWEYLSTKKTKEGVKLIHYGFQITPKEKFTTIDTVTIGYSNLVDYVKAKATAFTEKYAQ